MYHIYIDTYKLYTMGSLYSNKIYSTVLQNKKYDNNNKSNENSNENKSTSDNKNDMINVNHLNGIHA